MPKPAERFMTIAEACKTLRVTPKTLLSYRHEFACVKFERHVLIERASFEAWLASRATGGAK